MRAIIKGKRVILRKWKLSDAPTVAKYCSNKEIQYWVSSMPHPYRTLQGKQFIRNGWKQWRARTDYCYAITVGGQVVGSIGLHAKKPHRMDFGYWMGKPHRGKGYTFEAARLLLREAFTSLKPYCIYARYLIGNEASQGVMRKLGMKYEGIHRGEGKRGKTILDVACYSILRKEFQRQKPL